MSSDIVNKGKKLSARIAKADSPTPPMTFAPEPISAEEALGKYKEYARKMGFKVQLKTEVAILLVLKILEEDGGRQMRRIEILERLRNSTRRPHLAKDLNRVLTRTLGKLVQAGLAVKEVR